MTDSIKENFELGSQLLSEYNEETAGKLLENEMFIDKCESALNEYLLKITSKRLHSSERKLASELLNSVSDLERIGDQASDIAELVPYVHLDEGTGLHIGDMARAVIRMVTDSVDSFVKRDLDLARAVYAADDKVDALFDQVKRELIGLIAQDASRGEQCMDLLMVAKYLERIGDHATNVAEWVEYSITNVHPDKN